MHPVQTTAGDRAQRTFTALLWALSHPGRSHALPSGGLTAFVAIAEALVDLETSYYTPDAELAPLLARTGGQARDIASAMYQFYPRLHVASLVALAHAPVGTLAYPDESATLVIGCQLGSGPTLRLSGPGIQSSIRVRLGGLPAGLWQLRSQVARYPLGWDLLFVDNDRVIGVPRTTTVTDAA